MNNTTDLADFGVREIMMARDLLDAWMRDGLPNDFDPEGVTVMLNPMSGWVFLTNSDFEVAIVEDCRLVTFHTSPYDGHEGTLAELVIMCDPDTWNGEDIRWLASLIAAEI